MTIRSAVAFFAARPKASAVLSALFALLGLVCISGFVPASPNRIYLPGQWWLLAAISWIGSVIVGYGAIRGFRAGSGKARR